jgi:hypothetical protein
MGLADAEGLFLMDIDMGLDWRYPPTGRMPAVVAETDPPGKGPTPLRGGVDRKNPSGIEFQGS